MSAALAAAATALTIAALASVAADRMRAFRLDQSLVNVHAVAIAGLVTLARGWLASRGIGGIDTSVVFGIAAVASITDLGCGYVFDRVLLAGGTAIIALAVLRGSLAAALIGGAAGASVTAVPWLLTRRRGMGLGDVKLAGVLGCALGPAGSLRALWFAFVIGALVAAAAMVTRRCTRDQALPFAPFLALGAVLSTGSVAW